VRTTLAAVFLFAAGFIFQAHAGDHHLLHPLFQDVKAYVTGYNTTPGQTDDTPCIAASGLNICGRTDAVACPRRISLGTVLQIRGMLYVCEDRLAKKYDSRFDISCDKDTNCPPSVTGWTTIRVFPVRRVTPADGEPQPAANPTQQPVVTDAQPADVPVPPWADEQKS
jgi:hypothetical protein